MRNENITITHYALRITHYLRDWKKFLAVDITHALSLSTWAHRTDKIVQVRADFADGSYKVLRTFDNDADAKKYMEETATAYKWFKQLVEGEI